MKERAFQDLVWQKGRELYRDMPWRQDTRPYYVLVSELMLQQTQVDRVIPKFTSFIERFPNVRSLAQAPLQEVLRVWSGLGYNRRAKYLHEAAKMIMLTYTGSMPSDVTHLQALPGVGPGTAGALMAYAYNQPVVFIETNVRTVYFECFFSDGRVVADAELRPLIERTLDRQHPREFYWALMDYGSWLKRHNSGRLNQSRHYIRQTSLKGSLREIRGQILKTLTSGEMTLTELKTQVTYDERFVKALDGLIADGLVVQSYNRLHLTK